MGVCRYWGSWVKWVRARCVLVMGEGGVGMGV